jgi:hypothetical protein
MRGFGLGANRLPTRLKQRGDTWSPGRRIFWGTRTALNAGP